MSAAITAPTQGVSYTADSGGEVSIVVDDRQQIAGWETVEIVR